MKQTMLPIRDVLKLKSGNKFHARRTMVDGIKFPSRAQAARYVELRIEEEKGFIDSLNAHPMTHKLAVNGGLIGTYTPDFVYRHGVEWVTEDVKGGPVSRDVPLRLKLMEWCHGIKVQIVKMPDEKVGALLGFAAAEGRIDE